MVKARFQQVYVIADNFGRAHAFYEGALGLQTRFTDQDRWVQLSDGAAKFAIASQKEAPKDATAPVAVFEVDSLEEAARDIAAHGGRILDTRDMGDHGRTASFLDTEGNLLQLFARSRPSTP